MPSEELSALCAGLQRFLRLSDWRVDIDFAEPRKLGRCDYAHVVWNANEMTAIIRIRSEDSQRRAHMRVVPYGPTVAHELIHLKLEGHTNDGNPHPPTYEAGIDHLAEITWNAFNATSQGRQISVGGDDGRTRSTELLSTLSRVPDDDRVSPEQLRSAGVPDELPALPAREERGSARNDGVVCKAVERA